MSNEHSHISGAKQGTRYYVAPEVEAHGRLSPAADVYAWAVLCLELCTGTPIAALHQQYMQKGTQQQHEANAAAAAVAAVTGDGSDAAAAAAAATFVPVAGCMAAMITSLLLGCCPEALWSLLVRCTVPEPALRPTFEEVQVTIADIMNVSS